MIQKFFGLTFLVVTLFFSCVNSAVAYPEMIRLGYVQCQACHTSSLGGGLLTPYGKSVRTSLSLYQRKEETAFESMLNANVFLRYLWIESDKQKDHFLMQLDAAARADVTKTMGFETIIGMVPERVKSRPGAPSGLLGKSFLVRRLIVDHSFGEGKPRLIFGRDFLPRGTNPEDHTSYLRAYDRQGVTDYPTQLRVEVQNDKDITHLGIYGPSGEENSNAREWGAFGRYEHTLMDRWSLGTEVIAGQTKDLGRLSTDLFTRFGVTPTFGSLIDFQWVERKRSGSGNNFGQGVVFVQPYYAPTEWSMVRYRIEKLYRASPYTENAFRHVLGLEVKLISELSIITAVEKTRRAGMWSDSLYTIQLFSQL